MQKQDETFLLVAIKGSSTRVVKEGVIKIIQGEKSKLKKDYNWKGWIFQVRTPEGYKKVKILIDKKTGEVKK